MANGKRRVSFRFRKSIPHTLQVVCEDIARVDTQRRARNVRDQARINVRRRSKRSSGKIAGSIRYATAKIPDGWAAQVGSDLPEALWVERGTGVYGPSRHVIVPTTRQFMVFRSYTNSRRHSGRILVFARQVRGQPGKHYLRDAAEAFRI